MAIHLTDLPRNLMNTDTSISSETNDFFAQHAILIANSFERLLACPLIARKKDENLAFSLHHAPFVLLSHNTQPEPTFNYANAQALALFELTWEELIRLPSLLSAEPVNQEERAKLLAQVTKRGFIDNYEGVRISKTGKRFKIRNAIVWNLLDNDGIYQGQAACFSEWQFL